MEPDLQFMLGQLAAKVEGNCKAIDEIRDAQSNGFASLASKLDALHEKHIAQRDVVSRVLGGLAIVAAVVFKIPPESFAAWLPPHTPKAP